MNCRSEKFIRMIAFLLLICFLLPFVFGCENGGPNETTTVSGEEPPLLEIKDYVSLLKLDMSSDTLKQEVTVRSFVDGDTTHFHVPEHVISTGILKARYLAVNTPESTGKIEEYGKAASNFTRSKLENAESIIIESDDGKWNVDSTGGRYLVWVWYKPAGESEYRNLNLEILQNGLAIASSTANNRYGQTCVAALNQAKAQKLNVYSGEPDPDFYYGDAVELTLKELRLNPEIYNGKKVAFEGIISSDNNNSVYVEEYDSETDMYFGISVYYGFSLNGAGLEVISVGNRSRIVGTVQYYEAGGVYQVSGLSYNIMRPDDPGNLRKISDGHTPAYRETSAAIFASDVTIETEDGVKTAKYAELTLNTTIFMKDLKVIRIESVADEDSSSYGEMTLICEADDGTQIQVRTEAMNDSEGKLVTPEDLLDKNIDIKGIVDYFGGNYQIKVFSYKHIMFNN